MIHHEAPTDWTIKASVNFQSRLCRILSHWMEEDSSFQQTCHAYGMQFDADLVQRNVKHGHQNSGVPIRELCLGQSTLRNVGARSTVFLQL